MKNMTLILTMCWFSWVVVAQEKLTEHTFKLAPDAPLGTGKLTDVAWLAGAWQGTAFGSRFEEVQNTTPIRWLACGNFMMKRKGLIFTN